MTATHWRAQTVANFMKESKFGHLIRNLPALVIESYESSVSALTFLVCIRIFSVSGTNSALVDCKGRFRVCLERS